MAAPPRGSVYLLITEQLTATDRRAIYWQELALPLTSHISGSLYNIHIHAGK